jgi:CrcB protein
MGASGFVAVGVGGALGCWLRWVLGLRLNALLPQMPLGTLAANLLGGFLVGVAVAYFNRSPHLPPEYRQFVVVGFMGGLTTFSSFSAEVVTLMANEDYLWALGTASVHLLGSLVLTGVGMYCVKLVMG